MSNYVRGQETATHKVNSVVRNFVGLVTFSACFDVLLFSLFLYFRLPHSVWQAEHQLFVDALHLIKANGIFAIPSAGDYVTRGTTNQCSSRSLCSSRRFTGLLRVESSSLRVCLHFHPLWDECQEVELPQGF